MVQAKSLHRQIKFCWSNQYIQGLFAMADRSVSEPPKIYEHITMPIVQSGSNGNSPDMTVQKYY